MALSDQRTARFRELLESAARAASANGDSVRLPHTQVGIIFTLDVTVDESTAADKLDVSVQTKIDGTNWIDVVAFTQHAGNAGAKRYVAKVSGTAAESMFTNTALAAGSIRNLIGDEWRVSATVTDDSGSASFTFSVTALAV